MNKMHVEALIQFEDSTFSWIGIVNLGIQDLEIGDTNLLLADSLADHTQDAIFGAVMNIRVKTIIN
jgi:hypothetical protein